MHARPRHGRIALGAIDFTEDADEEAPLLRVLEETEDNEDDDDEIEEIDE